VEQLGLNGGFFLVQLVNFGIIFAALLFVYPRVLKVLDTRSSRIAKSLEDARVAEQARANAERDAQHIVDEQRSSAAHLVDQARVQAEDQARGVLEQARKDAEDIRAKARQDAEQERTQLLGEVRTQVAQLAIAASERLIGQSLDANRSQQIISEFFTRTSADLKGLGDTVDVTTALPLTDAEKGTIASQIGAHNITYRVDPSILGGVIVRSGDRVVDGSIRAGMTAMASRLR